MRVLLSCLALIQILLTPLDTVAAEVAYNIDTIAGTDFVGDGGPATAAQLGSAESVAVDASGNVYIADAADHRVRKISPTGLISTVAGNGHPGSSGDGGAATGALLAKPYGVAVDRYGNLYIVENGYDSLGLKGRVRKVTPDGTIRTIAGGGVLLADGTGDATAAKLAGPRNVAVDASGNVYVSEFAGHRVYRITVDGVISVVAGTGVAGDTKEEVPATLAQLNYPKGLAVDSSGTLYIADSGNHAIRKVANGVMTTLVRGGREGAAATVLNDPTGVAVDLAGNVYFADNGNARIRRVLAGGTVPTTVVNKDSTVATGSVAPSSWRDVALDAYGALYIADGQRVAKYDSTAALRTIAGDGTYEFRASGTLATMNRLYGPYGVALDAVGNLYIADLSLVCDLSGEIHT
jgi:trimeric autotransporter adhesin